LATVATAPALAPSRTSCRWLIGRTADLALVSGSSLAGFVYLLLFLSGSIPVSYLWWFWSAGFDGTHIFATATRTYFDPATRREQRRLLFGSLVFFFSLGPVMVLAGWKLALAVLVGTWAYYHVARQHYGFAMLYKVKNRDLDPADNRLDKLFLAAMLGAPPFLRFFVYHPEELGLPSGAALSRLIPGSELVVAGLAVAVAGCFVQRQVMRWRLGLPLNVPKLLLMGSVAALHWLTFSLLSWKAAVPTVTIVHNLQYHALVIFYHRNRTDSGPGEETALSGRIARSLAFYAIAALAFSLLYRVPGAYLGRLSDLAFGLFCGFGLTHYYLDSRIWRVRDDPSLRAALRLDRR
jgi:hypothetical protein